MATPDFQRRVATPDVQLSVGTPGVQSLAGGWRSRRHGHVTFAWWRIFEAVAVATTALPSAPALPAEGPSRPLVSVASGARTPPLTSRLHSPAVWDPGDSMSRCLATTLALLASRARVRLGTDGLTSPPAFVAASDPGAGHMAS